jgi:hypothetical protein
MSDVLDKVTTAIKETLLGGYIDGHPYLRDEWTLKRLWHNSKLNYYYALVQVDTFRCGVSSSLYQIDANNPDWGTVDCESAIIVGKSVFAGDDCKEITI